MRDEYSNSRSAAMPLQAQSVRPETIIKWRQSAYQVMSWSTSRIRANVEGQFSRDELTPLPHFV